MIDKNFWDRLENFMSNVQVNDAMSEEERRMIIHVCNEQQNYVDSEKEFIIEITFVGSLNKKNEFVQFPSLEKLNLYKKMLLASSDVLCIRKHIK